MSEFTRFIQRIQTQTCVYWEPLQSDGFGGKTFALPVEHSCRWEEVINLKVTDKADVVEASNYINIKIITSVPFKLNGYLFLGALTDIVESPLNPVEVNQAYKILQVFKTPTISGKALMYEHLL